MSGQLSVYAVQTAPLEVLMLVAYPAVFPLHAAGWGDVGPDGALTMPPTVPASGPYLEQHGAYLVDAGHIMFVWIGQLAGPELIQVRACLFQTPKATNSRLRV